MLNSNQEAKMEEITLRNGRKVTIYEYSFKEMAGETATILHVRWSDTKRQVPLRKILPLMNDFDKRKVQEWQASLDLWNEATAIAWVI